MKISYLLLNKNPIILQLFLIVWFIFIGNLLISCDSKKEQANEIDYIKYTTIINEAERFILDSNYSDALARYKEAIKLVDYPLANHCFTAMQLSAKLDNVDSFKNFTNEALKSGLGQSHFNRDSLLKDYIVEKRLNTFISDNHKQFHSNYEARINSELKDTIIKLVEWDTKWKNYYIETMVRKHPENEDFYYEKYDSIISLIVDNHLIPLIKEHGYPGERIIGFETNGWPDSYDYTFSNNNAKVLLMHYYIKPKSCNYNNLFLEEVKKGNMSSNAYALLMDFQARNGADKICNNFKIYNEHYIIEDTTRFKEFNINRAEIGLGTVNEVGEKYERGKKICNEKKRLNKYKQIKLFYWCG